MYCKNCGKEIPDGAKFCQGCGKPVIPERNISDGPDIPAAPKKKNTALIVAIILLSLALIISLSALVTEQTESEPAPAPVVQTEAPAVTRPAPVREVKATKPVEAGFDVKDYRAERWGEGMYKVGQDIDPGEYQIISNGRLHAYLQIDSDSSGKFASIVHNDNIATFAFFRIEEGQYLTVKRGYVVAINDADVPGPDADGNYGPGMYRVGTDIPAGEYRVTASGQGIVGSAYVEIDMDCSGKFSSIVSNDNFENSGYFTVYDGQYLTVNRGTFKPA